VTTQNLSFVSFHIDCNLKVDNAFIMCINKRYNRPAPITWLYLHTKGCYLGGGVQRDLNLLIQTMLMLEKLTHFRMLYMEVLAIFELMDCFNFQQMNNYHCIPFWANCLKKKLIILSYSSPLPIHPVGWSVHRFVNQVHNSVGKT